jgi:undecaprenyl-diphosphatase
MPVMAASTGYDLLKSVMGKGENPIGVSQIDAHGWTLLVIGLVMSFVVGYASVAWFMAWVRKHGFVPFAVYRIIAGIVVLVWIAKLAA